MQLMALSQHTECQLSTWGTLMMDCCEDTLRRGGRVITDNFCIAVSPCSNRKHSNGISLLIPKSAYVIFPLLFNSVDQNSLPFLDSLLKLKTGPGFGERCCYSNRNCSSLSGYVVITQQEVHQVQAPPFRHNAKLILHPSGLMCPLEAQEDFPITSTNPCVQIPASVIAGCLWF